MTRSLTECLTLMTTQQGSFTVMHGGPLLGGF